MLDAQGLSKFDQATYNSLKELPKEELEICALHYIMTLQPIFNALKSMMVVSGGTIDGLAINIPVSEDIKSKMESIAIKVNCKRKELLEPKE